MGAKRLFSMMSCLSDMQASSLRLKHIKAILFDQHLTITDVTDDILSMTRKAAHSGGISLEGFSDEEISSTLQSVNEWFSLFQIEHDVDIFYGSEVEHWIEANRVMFEQLGIRDLSDEHLISIERNWRERLKSWEVLRSDAEVTLSELHKRGYKLGICTRRPDDPTNQLREWGIYEILSTIQWTSVPGYSKPYPYTLILAANEIGVNPIRCAYVGNSIEADIIAAQRAGMLPVLTTWSKPEAVENAPEGTLVVGELSELLDLFPGCS
jgi:HAD superfamily hydrolase (TIGR01549 family)